MLSRHAYCASSVRDARDSRVCSAARMEVGRRARRYALLGPSCSRRREGRDRKQQQRQQQHPCLIVLERASSSSNAARADAYRNFEIWKPAEGESLDQYGRRGHGQCARGSRPARRVTRCVSISTADPSKAFLPTPTTFELKDVPRGSHRVIAVISDSRGAPVRETTPVNFVVRQESIAAPPVGPNLRPPPKPRPGGSANKLPTQQPSYAALNGARAPVDPSTNKPARKPATAPPPPKSGG